MYSPAVISEEPPEICDTPEMQIRIESASGISGVTLETDENCVVSVYEIRRSLPEDDDELAYDPSVIEYSGWAKSELNDKWNVDLATVNSQIDYLYDGSSVYDGHNEGAYCTSFHYPGGWSIKGCTYASSLNGPESVWVRGHGDFHHGLTNTDVWQRAKFTGRDNNTWYVLCTHSDNNPTGTHWECSGDRDRLD